VTIILGEELRSIEGFVAWDFGRLVLAGDALVYAGEKTRFSLPRAEITAIETVSRPMGWGSAKALWVRWQGGSFLVRKATIADSRRQMAALERRWTAWWKSGDCTTIGVPAGDFPSPNLPAPAIHNEPPSARPSGGLLRLMMFMVIVGFAVAAMKSFTPPAR